MLTVAAVLVGAAVRHAVFEGQVAAFGAALTIVVHAVARRVARASRLGAAAGRVVACPQTEYEWPRGEGREGGRW